MGNGAEVPIACPASKPKATKRKATKKKTTNPLSE